MLVHQIKGVRIWGSGLEISMLEVDFELFLWYKDKGWRFMKCGYCKNEMIRGFIPIPAIEWRPENGIIRMLYGNDKEQGFRIGRQSFFDMREQEAWYCPVCDKLVIDCKDDWNNKAHIGRILFPFLVVLFIFIILELYWSRRQKTRSFIVQICGLGARFGCEPISEHSNRRDESHIFEL